MGTGMGMGMADAPPLLPRPCHSARMALLCAQNALCMGARTQLALCPPGRARRKLAGRLRKRRRDAAAAAAAAAAADGGGGGGGGGGPSHPPSAALARARLGGRRATSSAAAADDGFAIERILGEEGLAAYDRAEEECASDPDYLDREVIRDGEELLEEPSSGDDDELDADGDGRGEGAAGRDSPGPGPGPGMADQPYVHREPLYTPSGSDPSAGAHGAGGNATGGSAASGKIPFNYRKLRCFDGVTASHRAAARAYLKAEMRKLRKRDGAQLVRHLQRMQRRERRLLQAGGQPDGTPASAAATAASDDEAEEAALAQEQAALGVASFPDRMTSGLSAALVLESLAFNPLESVEGMSKCYDAIVAAGTALLDAEVDDSNPSSPLAARGTNAAAASPFGGKREKKPTKSEIMAALAPVLVTTLEQPSGEAILALANLRRLCGTKRYQRRFVQRVAPSLLRPPGASMWCLRHQNDMEAILAASEMVFDSAHDIFSSGWHERGRMILADSVRAGALRSAADQLKSLSSAHNSDSLITGLAGSRMARGNALKMGGPQSKEGAAPLAEWEVLSVDAQIRKSIDNLFSRDWSRPIVPARTNPRDDASTGSYRNRRGISSAKTKVSVADDASAASNSSAAGLAPPSSFAQPHPSPLATSALSPRSHPKAPPFPLSPQHYSVQATDPLDLAVGESLQQPELPGSPSAGRKLIKSIGGLTPPGTPTHAREIGTPPRSPGHAPERKTSFDGSFVAPPQLPSMNFNEVNAPLTPNRTLTPQSTAIVHSPAPMSPMSAGNQSYDSNNAIRMSGSASISSSAAESRSAQQYAQTAYLRTLTSTAAERKRTVAACRALRAQISRFEEAFVQLHGRPPKGAAERAPLATTYAQYREWKRAIRADAACRIQALFRGARVRWMLLRSNNPRMSRVVLTRAGRPDFAEGKDRSSDTSLTISSTGRSNRGGQNHVLNKISIPVEIGGERDESLQTPILTQKGNIKSPRPGVMMPTPDDEDGGPTPSLSPNWTSKPNLGARGTEPAISSPSNRAQISHLTFGGVHINDLPTQELQARKRELKQQLKQYDMNFAKIHGRMPVKAEKEPIRHLYESYNALKSRITFLERDGSNNPGPPMPYRRTLSLTSNASADSSGDEGPEPSRSKRKDKALAGGMVTTVSMSGSTSPSSAPSQDLAALKVEKGQLHQMLRSYEKDFFRLHNRQVSSFADIRPVASQYRRYKEIKKSISALAS